MMSSKGVGILLIVLFVQCMYAVSQTRGVGFQPDIPKTTRYWKIKTEEKCNKVTVLGQSEHKIVTVELSDSNCSSTPDRHGFHCSIYFHYGMDNFNRLGHTICIDIQGVAKSIPSTQMLYMISEGFQSLGKDLKELKRVYIVTRTDPPDKPYYVCASSDSTNIRLSLHVKDVVEVCKKPPILDQIVAANINLGTVINKQNTPMYILKNTVCNHKITSHYHNYLIKIDSAHFGRRKCVLNFVHDLPTGKYVACFVVVYYSDDLDCSISLSLVQGKRSEQGLMFRTSNDLNKMKKEVCYPLESSIDPVVLSIANNRRMSTGKFVVSVNITQQDKDDTDDADVLSKEHLQHLYMAVFISLICLCLLILAVTFVCCLRIRSKRAWQRASRSRHQSRHNEAFQSTPNPPSFPGISWDQSDPDHVAGLPTYDQVVQQGSNPVDDTDKPEMPPPYDSLSLHSIMPTTPFRGHM